MRAKRDGGEEERAAGAESGIMVLFLSQVHLQKEVDAGRRVNAGGWRRGRGSVQAARVRGRRVLRRRVR